MNSKKDWINELDYLRGIAIIAVIAIHCFQSPFPNLESYFRTTVTNDYIILYNNFVGSYSNFAVPLFVFISGLAISHNYSGKLQIFDFYLKRVISIVPPYTFFSLLSILGLSVFGGLPTIKTVLYMLLNGKASDPLWFIILILQLYIIYPILEKFYIYFSNKKMGVYFLLSCLLIQLIFSSSWDTFLLIFKSITNGKFWNPIFLKYLFYFIFGIYSTSRLDILRHNIINYKFIPLVGISLILNLYIVFISKDLWGLANFWYSLSKLIFNLIMFAICFKLSVYLSFTNSSFSQWIRSIGRYSFSIYLIHPFLIYMISFLLFFLGLDFNNFSYYHIQFVSTILLSYFSSYTLSYLPYSKWFIGTHIKSKNKKLKFENENRQCT